MPETEQKPTKAHNAQSVATLPIKHGSAESS